MVIATWEGGKKLALATELVCTYMEPLYCVSRGKTGEAVTGKRDFRNRGLVVSFCEHRWCLFQIYRKAGMRQPSEPESAPIQEGMTQHTVIVGRNNDLARLCRKFSYGVGTHFPLPQREVIVVWHVSSYPEPF